ncbi:MAG: hypothetical protein OXL34_10320 [Gemmatimonadota bacterium]|nr:hypothetical protein [Gemmatimonadota bacterium]
MGRNPKWWKDPALVTILVAVVTGAWVVSSRINSVEAALGERIGRLERSTSERFGAVEAGLAALEARIELLLEGLDITVTLRK